MIIKKDLTLKLLTTGKMCCRNCKDNVCDDTACKLIKPLQQQKDTGNPSLNFELADNKVAIDCMLKAIDQLQKSMPNSLQQIYKEIKIQLEAKKAGF